MMQETDFGAVVRRARKRVGLTQVELAKIIGISQPHLTRLESGRSGPRYATFEKIADAFEPYGISIGAMMRGEVAATPTTTPDPTSPNDPTSTAGPAATGAWHKTLTPAAVIKRIREHVEMTQDELAKAVGISLPRLIRIETAASAIDMETLRSIAIAVEQHGLDPCDVVLDAIGLRR